MEINEKIDEIIQQAKEEKTMKKGTFDFSEALRRMKEGKKMRRKTKQWFLYEINDECLIRNYCKLDKTIGRAEYAGSLDSDDILATDWEEVRR